MMTGQHHRMTVHKWWVRGPLPDAVIDEIRRAHRLRNALVEIDKGHAETVAAVWAEHPQVAEAEEALAQAEAVVVEAVEAVKKAKIAAGGKVPKHLREAAAAARRERKERKAALRAAKDDAYATVKPAMIEAREDRRARQKDLYRTHIDQGLYWASFNDVKDGHETAVKQIAAKRKQGQPAELRFHRWTGEGTIAVQLQRQAGDPARTVEMLGDPESKWRNVARLDGYPEDPTTLEKRDWRRLARRGEVRLTFRIGSGDCAELVTIPVAVDREVPADADITGMQITRRLIGGKERASVSVVMRCPVVPAVTSGPTTAIHLGWRSKANGSIRVAVVQGAPTPPRELVEAGVVVDHRDWCEVVVPPGWVDWDARLAGVAAQRDQSHNVAKAGLIDWLSERPESPEVPGRDGEPEPLQAHRVKQWRSPNRLAWLARLWRDDPPDGGEELAARLEAWRRQDHHLWQWHAHGTDKLVGRRLDLWRKVARWVTAEAAVVVVDEWKVADLIRDRSVVEDERDRAAESGRRNARLAAPGLLREQVNRAAGAAGVEVAHAGADGYVHHRCGGVLDPDSRRTSHLVACTACGSTVDQDHNRLMWMVASGDAAA